METQPMSNETPDSDTVQALLDDMNGLVRDGILEVNDLEEILRSTVKEGLVNSMELEDLTYYLVQERAKDPVDLLKRIAQEVFIRRRG